MHSRADQVAAGRAAPLAAAGLRTEQVLRVVGGLLHASALLCIGLLLWHLAAPTVAKRTTAGVTVDAMLDTPLPALLRGGSDTIDITLAGTPDARTRARVSAVRASGHVVRLFAPRTLPSLAMSVEAEWKATGGSRILVAGRDSTTAGVADGAGALDSMHLELGGSRAVTGPVQGALRARQPGVTASVEPLVAGAPLDARVLVVGNATWESRFLMAAFEEAGWPVDAALTVSPKVTIGQGAGRTPMRGRHAVVVLLPGAPTAAVNALTPFVRDGGGLLIVGEAARLPGLGALRAGAPGATLAGELGAEASGTPRHGLDLVPIATLASGAVMLEERDGRTAIAARRVGAGRVLQVGYDNSWLWRMAGDDASVATHRRWWNALLSSVVSLRSPAPRIAHDVEDDTLDAAPLVAMVRDLGVPVIRDRIDAPERSSLAASLDPRWLLAAAAFSLVVSWVIRRWRGLI